MEQIFELPGMVRDLFINISTPIAIFSIVIRIVSMLGIISLSALLVEYMNDGSIYNRAFNIICVITILLHVVIIVTSANGLILLAKTTSDIDVNLHASYNMLVIFNNLYRIAMVFLFVFFAYDSAKKQLLKVDFSK